MNEKTTFPDIPLGTTDTTNDIKEVGVEKDAIVYTEDMVASALERANKRWEAELKSK